MMKWLQWSYLDIFKGLGGVETHMRSLARELKGLGVDARLSSNPDDLLKGSWDIIHTHGSNLKVLLELQGRFRRRPSGSPLWVHTLHGLTHERMLACEEYLWPGGYRAILREVVGSLNADVLFAIHPEISLFNLLKKTSKKCVIAGNGWDPWIDSESTNLSREIQAELSVLKNFWVFIGRGGDRMKGVELLLPALESLPNFKLVAVPGEGFEKTENVLSLGPLTPSQIRNLLGQSKGLILTSRYEGLPLVVLEALAEGVPVVSSLAGGLKTLSPEINGLFQMDFPTVEKIKKAVSEAERLPMDLEARKVRGSHNRKFLRTWQEVAKTALLAVNEALAERRQ